MSIPFMHLPATVGREDRLVRGCIAFSLLLLASFPVLASRGLTPITIGFLSLVLYFTVTAVLGRDPLYAHFGIDTGVESGSQSSPVDGLFTEKGPDPVVDVRVVDVRDSNESPAPEPRPDQVTGG